MRTARISNATHFLQTTYGRAAQLARDKLSGHVPGQTRTANSQLILWQGFTFPDRRCRSAIRWVFVPCAVWNHTLRRMILKSRIVSISTARGISASRPLAWQWTARSTAVWPKVTPDTSHLTPPRNPPQLLPITVRIHKYGSLGSLYVSTCENPRMTFFPKKSILLHNSFVPKGLSYRKFFS